MSDALHISGELLKSYKKHRPLSERQQIRMSKERDGEYVARNLEGGLRVTVLGINPSLNTAIENDFSERWLGIAQQLNAMAKTGDVFLGISTSGKAKNIYYADIVARYKGMRIVLLTGKSESVLSRMSDIVMHAPGESTDLIQEEHIALYHGLCGMLEQDFFA